MSNASAPVATQFKLTTTDAFFIKVLSELLNSNLTEANFHFKEDEITLREVDGNEEVMIDVVLRACDMIYEPPSETVVVGFTTQHLYKTLKRTKRKDRITMYKEVGSDLLSFNILNADKCRDKDGNMRCKDVPLSKWSIGDYPKLPITTIPAAEFQRMCKEMTAASKTITVMIQKNGVLFGSGNDLLFSISDKYGVWVEGGEIIYSQTFNSKQLSHLSKCSGLAPNNHLKVFCNGNDNPLMLTSPIGSIGTFKAVISPPKK